MSESLEYKLVIAGTVILLPVIILCFLGSLVWDTVSGNRIYLRRGGKA
jgi:hypothetical protein